MENAKQRQKTLRNTKMNKLSNFGDWVGKEDYKSNCKSYLLSMYQLQVHSSMMQLGLILMSLGS